MAEHVIRAAVADAGLADRVQVSSAGTGGWHAGQGASGGTVRVLQAAGYPSAHRARQVSRSILDSADLVLAADGGHIRELQDWGVRPEALRLLRSFDPDATDDDVPDPYGRPDAAYREVLTMVVAATPGIVEEIRRRLA